MNIYLILDESGSMGPLKAETISGFNTFLAEQQAVSKVAVAGKRVKPARLHVVKFDSTGIRKPIWDTPIEDVKAWTDKDYSPNAWTPLLDAVGDTLTEATGKKALVVIITDGQENSSHKFNKSQIKELIQKRQNEGWTVVYLGANVDAFAEAGGMGVAARTTAGYTPTAAGVGSTYSTLSDTAMLARSGMSNSVGNDAFGNAVATADAGTVGYLGHLRSASGSAPSTAIVIDPNTAGSVTPPAKAKPKAKVTSSK